MLDISIKNIESEPIFLKKLMKLSSLEIEEKIDGIKITVFRNEKPYNSENISDNFIFSYKGDVFLPEEFEYVNRKNAKLEGIGHSQFCFIIDHFKQIHSHLECIPNNTEFFIEFVMRKPTITRDYVNKHALVLLSISSATYKLNIGKFSSITTSFGTEQRTKYAEIMKLDIPYSFSISPSSFNSYEDLKQHVLQIESAYGGKIEGVIFNIDGKMFKILQDDQHDKIIRENKKLRWEMEKEKELEYFSQLKKYALKKEYDIPKKDFSEALLSCSRIAYNEECYFLPKHIKKTQFQKREDLFYILKYFTVRKIKGNNNCIFFGRMQPPTIAHTRIIEDCLKKYDNVAVAIVNTEKISDKTPFSFVIIQMILDDIFREKIQIISVKTANIHTAISKCNFTINDIICGSDRENSYVEQIKNNPELSVKVYDRNDDISATLLREIIQQGNFEKFKTLVHQNVVSFWYSLRQKIQKI